MPFLILGHGLVGLVGLATARSGADDKRPAFFLGAAGAVLGVALFFFRHAALGWRTTEMQTGPAVAAGLAVAAAWLLVAVRKADRHNAWDVPLVGVAGCALIMFALNRWVVPALLFWFVLSAALAVMARDEAQRVQTWLVLALSDALVAAALVTHALHSETWRLPSTTTGSTWWFLVAAALIRSGAIPRVGAWASSTTPALPLLAGSSLALITGIADNEQPWLALALVVGAIAIGGRALLADRFNIAVLGAWPIATMLCVLLVVPGAPWQAAAAALLGLTAVLLWPDALGRAQVERGVLLGFVPPTAAFSAIVAAAVATFDRATATSDVLTAAPWTGVTALLPVVVATGVVLGARIGRTPEPEHFEPASVIASWIVFGLAVAAGLWPRFLSPGDPGAGSKVLVLHVVALGLAVVAARWLARGPRSPSDTAVSLSWAALPVPPRVVNLLTWSGALFGGAGALAVLWLTFRGLQVGFL